jgi:GNAT superfamily N-acetyltransferase
LPEQWPERLRATQGRIVVINTVTVEDLPAVRRLIESSITHSITLAAAELGWLLGDIMQSLERWQAEPDAFLHLKYVDGDRIVGVLLLNDGWNLVNLFVAPTNYGQGIGRALVAAATEHARATGHDALCLNSSDFAVDFYRRLGFVQVGPGKDRPGGCVQMELTL